MRDLLMAARHLLIDHNVIACKEKLDAINEVISIRIYLSSTASILTIFTEIKQYTSTRLHPRLIKYLNRGYTFPEVDFFNIKICEDSGLIVSLNAVLAKKIV